jgi:hypothetical protein
VNYWFDTIMKFRYVLFFILLVTMPLYRKCDNFVLIIIVNLLSCLLYDMSTTIVILGLIMNIDMS